MAADGINVAEDAEMAECDGDKVVTMMDVLQEQQDFEEDANAVLGASDDKNCTYPKGYIKRQALYACLTCCTEAKTDPTKRAGVCLACSLMCHENHELIELYTKRNFRCDCGNPKFNSHPCQFISDKTDLNDENIYNQNFSGLYCTCQRPYPDPDNTADDDMIQCIICEDWLHASHLDATVPTSDYSEMICKACMEKNEFLHDYSRFAVNSENGDVDIINVNGLCNGDTEEDIFVNGVIEKIETEAANVNGDVEMNEENEKSEDKTEAHTEHNNISTDDNIEVTKQDMENKTTEDKDLSVDDVTSETQAKEETNESEVTSIQNETTIDDQIKDDTKVDDKMDNTNSESDEIGEPSTEQSESLEQTEEKGDSDKVHENAEQKLLNNLSALTEDIPAPTEEVKEPISDAKAAENTEQSDETKESMDSNTNNDELPKETSNENGDNIEDKPDDKSETTGHLEVPDTSQAEETENSNTADSVMDAIDELLESAEKSQESKTADKQESSVLAESKESSENIETNDICNKVDDIPEKATEELTDKNDKNNTDIEMSDLSKQDEVLTNDSKPDKPSTDSESESANVQESGDSTSEALVEENNIDNESPKKMDGDSEVADTIEENNDKENGDEVHKMTETTNKIEPSLEDVKASMTYDNASEHKRKLSSDLADDISSKKAKLECVRPKGVKRIYKGATFWPSNFRQKLCTCGECISMYKDLKVLFVTDPEDTVYAYESLGKENVAGGVSQYEKGLQALSSLDRIQQINALTEYNKMRDKLLDFLKSFKDRKEVVKEEDIKAFFAGMKPRREPDGVYFCR